LSSSDLFAQAPDTLKGPVVNIRVNKETDDQGNVIRYDSTYTWYWSSGDTLSADDSTFFRRFFSLPGGWHYGPGLLVPDSLPGIIFYPVTGHRKSVTRKIGVLRLTAGPAVAEMETLALFVAKTASGIPNREALSELVLHQLAYWERYRVSFSLLLLKIGNYRSVIGQLGPESWELASRSVYDQLAAYMRMTDKIGLYDESTYWVVLTNTTPEGSRVVADKIRRLVSTMQIGELEHPLEVVVGGVEARAGERVAEMLKRAEQEAAKAAKEASGISFST